MAFEIGQSAGPYEFVAIEGNSRIGAVYKVRNTFADRFELLRVLPKEQTQNREDVDRFLREIKVHARLSHPNIVSFYTATEIDGQVVTTSEWFEGTTLEKRLEAGPLPLAKALSCMLQVLAALSYAHELGIVHREISPANVLLGPDDCVKLTGFGLAKSPFDAQLTLVGTVMGWIEYMSPEQVKGLLTVDGRTDIYSAGAMLYEMVTGQVPFTGKSQFDVMAAHVGTAPQSPDSLRPGLPADLNGIILRALEKDPERRFQTAAQFRDALVGMVPARSAPAPEPAVVMPPPPVEWALPKLLFTGFFTFLVVMMALFAILKIARP
jgi:serine/threonine protein kinase